MAHLPVSLSSTVSQLLEGLKPVLPFVNRTSKFLPLQYVKLSMTEEGGMVEGTDLEVGYQGPLAIEGHGTVVAQEHALVELLKNCPPDARIVLTQTTTGMLRVAIGSHGRYQIRTVVNDDFPVIRREKEAGAQSIALRASAVAEVLTGTLFAMSKDMTRPSLGGIELKGDGAVLEATATDGFVLAHTTVASEPMDAFTVFIPGNAMPQVLSWLASLPAEESVMLSLEPSFLTLASGRMVITIRLTEATFVEWQRLVPEDVGQRLPFERAALLQTLRRGYALRDNKHCGTRFTSGRGQVVIEAMCGDEILAQEIVPCPTAEPGVHALLRTAYVIDTLGAIAAGEGTIHLGIRTSILPCVIYGEDRSASFALIIPQRDIGPGVWTPQEDEGLQGATAAVLAGTA